MEQLSLDGTSVALGRQAPRQDAVLKLLSEHPEGCSADEIGAAIHGSSGKHDAESTCAYCTIDSRAPLLSLIKKRLVTRTGNGQFTLRNDDAAGSGAGRIAGGILNRSPCAVCGVEILVCDNGVHLDTPAVSYDEASAPWTLMVMAGRVFASVGDPSPNGFGHSLHAHQPGDGE